MHQIELRKIDGRQLTLYSSVPMNMTTMAAAPSPFAQPQQANPHSRWHPLRGEWVVYAAFRQDRTFQPPPQYNPLAVTVDASAPTELPAGDYEIAVFDNRFPALALTAHDPPALTVATAPAQGQCEVVVFTQDPQATLASLSLARIDLLLQVWADRTERLRAIPGIQYVMPFENRGAEVGVTLHHPHGQIYGYPFVPPVPARMQQQETRFYTQHRAPLLQRIAHDELEQASRVLYQGPHAIAFVPVCARYPYEVWVMPLAQIETFDQLSAVQRADLARALKTVLLKYDGLWQRPFPYLMIWYQAPLDGHPHPETQLHAELYPPYRSRDRLKYLAGTEIGAGTFVMDALPEDKARELQQVAVELEPA